MCTPAVETSDAVDAGASVATWRRCALVDVLRTVTAGETRSACAPEIVDQLSAGGAVGAWPSEAFVDVVLTQGADETGRTAALEVILSVNALASVETRVNGAFVTVDFTTRTGKTQRAHAAISIDSIDAGTAYADKQTYSQTGSQVVRQNKRRLITGETISDRHTHSAKILLTSGRSANWPRFSAIEQFCDVTVSSGSRSRVRE